jgi:tripartite-type tricarboxylate transporter receptor subunit TctC
VVLAGSVPNVVCVHPSVPAKSLRELIELARTRPLAYASPGIGTTPHLSMERIKSAAKITLTHVPYQPAAAADRRCRRTDRGAESFARLTLPQLKAGKLRALAVTSARRSAVLPDVPTVNEQGFEGFDDLNWFGFFAPAGVPAGIVAGYTTRSHARSKPARSGKSSTSSASIRGPIRPASSRRSSGPKWSKWARAVKDSGAKAE